VRFLPRSLLWRTVLLLALLLAVSHIAWIAIFRYAQREPRAHQVAQQIVSVVVLTRAALISAEPAKRLALLRDLSSEEGIQVYPARDNESIADLPDRPGLKIIAREVRDRLGPDTRISLARDGVPGVWVSFPIDDDDYWVMLPRTRIERQEPWLWAGLGVFVVLLSLAGAIVIVSRVNRPLRALARAAGDIGRGREAPPVPEQGPTEITAVTKAFNQMASDLQRTDRERALMLAGVSHDLRTPLSRIRLGVEMLDERLDPALTQGMVQDIEEIDAVINQFLDFARGGAEGDALTPDADLDALIANVVERYRTKGADVTFAPGALPRLPLRTLAIGRLLGNLINNALRHAKTTVEITTHVEGGHAVVSVCDRGPGIPAADSERMLQPFTRLSTARTDSGSGLGLAIVERIARMHQGRVELRPRAGGGLEARVSLPLAPTAH
jgi:two-component system osmolarity sensor histidine kinase EnvZ